jgi:predicted transglutaminase-like cysteine proteinase
MGRFALRSLRFRHLAWTVACVVLVAGLAGCASISPPHHEPTFDFFAAAIPDNADADPWYPKVAEWQGRMREEGTRLPPTTHSLRAAEQSGRLLQVMGAFRDQQRVELARRITDLAQHLARKYYKWDPASQNPAYDHWPTVGELLGNNGDDCDGLDLIAYQLLREFGYPSDRVYRAVIRRNRDRANHMVTLWFEDDTDPWVLDATGAVTLEMRHFSELEGWTPTKVFNEDTQYLARIETNTRAVARGR